MFRLLGAVLLPLTLSLSACGTAPISPDSLLMVVDQAPFASSAAVSVAVQNECQLETLVPSLVVDELGDKARLVHGEPGPGHVLRMTIYEINGTGGGTWSGRKSVAVQGSLTEEGRVVGTFSAKRISSSFGHGFSGTCKILRACTESVAEEIAQWVKHPTMNARLRDAEYASPQPQVAVATYSATPVTAPPVSQSPISQATPSISDEIGQMVTLNQITQMHIQASPQATVNATLAAASKVKRLSGSIANESGEWCFVKSDAATGWIPASAIVR